MATDKNTGKPKNKAYLEKNLPAYLLNDIKSLIEGQKKQVNYLDCLRCEVHGSINSAEVDELISNEQATYLKNKYVYPKDEEND